MASSRVMPSSSSANSDLARQSSIYSLNDPARNLGSMSMEDLLHNIYGDGTVSPFADAVTNPNGEASVSRQGSFTLNKGVASKTVEEVSKEISASNTDREAAGEMTLEDFLSMAVQEQIPIEDGGEGEERRGRGRKRMGVDPGDKVVVQRQKRMIKNRESAARSRERKQAYTMELESLALQLEEENTELLAYQAEQDRMRLKLLMENVIPITQKENSRRLLRRTRSMQW